MPLRVAIAALLGALARAQDPGAPLDELEAEPAPRFVEDVKTF